ncbi:MAG: hypothetical protein AAGN82_07905 [Myxococcota bacterium]
MKYGAVLKLRAVIDPIAVRTPTRRPLVVAALLGGGALAGCQDNLTEPVRDDYRTRDPAPLTCLPNLDGRIDATEIQPALGVDVRYLISPDGTTREVDFVGTDGGDRTVWDFGTDFADDQVATVTPAALDGQWFADAFPADTFVTPFDGEGRTLSINRYAPDIGLQLLGLASRDPAPPEGQTLLVYSPAITVLRFPIQTGDTFVSQGDIIDGTLRGLPYAGTDTYEVTVDARGEVRLPQLTFDEAHRVRTRVTVQPAVGTATSTRQVSFFTECFAEVVRVTSPLDEDNPDFAVAQQLRRLGF